MSATATRSDLPLVVATVEVVAVTRLSPSFVRVELGGSALAEVGVDGPLLDQRIKLVLPDGRGAVPELAAHVGWYRSWQQLPDDRRGHLRTYSLRDVRGNGADTRIVVDVVLHLADGATGPGARWAAAARPGDRVGVVAPRKGRPFGGIEFTPRPTDRLLLVGDETAVPAVARILEDLPEDAAGSAWLEVPDRRDVLPLRVPPGVSVAWLPRRGAAYGDLVCRAVAQHLGLDGAPCDDGTGLSVEPDLWETPTYSSSGEVLTEPPARSAEPVHGLYAWVAGEAGTVTRLRRTLVRDAGLHRSQVAFMGYWRQGVAMRS